MELLTLVIIGIYTAVYALTVIYQANKFKALESTVNNQQKLIQDFEKYKSLFDIDDFGKRLQLKLDNQKDELERHFNSQAKSIVEQTLKVAGKTFKNENKNILGGWEELCQIALSIAMKQYPTKADKAKRDKHFKDNYPKNAEYFIHFCDDLLEGKIDSIK